MLRHYWLTYLSRTFRTFLSDSICHRQYFANSLGLGLHSLVLTADPERNEQQNAGTLMDVDAITVYSASGSTRGNISGGSSPGRPDASDSSSSTLAKHSLSDKTIGIIAGVSAGALLLLAVAVAVVLFFVWRRHLSEETRWHASPDSGLPRFSYVVCKDSK